MPKDYTPPGTCFDNVCYIEPEQLDVRMSWYDPALGGINCQEPCDTLGDGSLVEEHYDNIIACPQDWYGQFLSIEDVGTFQCRDSGSLIIPTCQPIFFPGNGTEFECYITLDFLSRGPPKFAYLLKSWKFTENPRKSFHERIMRTWLTLHLKHGNIFSGDNYVQQSKMEYARTEYDCKEHPAHGWYAVRGGWRGTRCLDGHRPR